MERRHENEAGFEAESSNDDNYREYLVALRVCALGMKCADVGTKCADVGTKRADAHSFLKCTLGKAHQ